MATTISITSQSVPTGFCFTNWNESWPILVSLLRASLGETSSSGGTVDLGTSGFINIGKSTPDQDDRDKPWLRINSNDSVDRWYWWDIGVSAWVWPHEVPPSDDRIYMFVGLDTAVATLDGGDALPTPIAATTGQFWEIYTPLQARFPVGVGTFPVSLTNVTRLGTGGVDQYTLTTDQIPAHTHIIRNPYGSGGTAPGFEGTGNDAPGTYNLTTDVNVTLGSPVNNIPPYMGVYFIKRTARKFYVAT